MNKKKIVFVIASMNSGGAERVMSILVNEAVQQNYDVTLLLTLSGNVHYTLSKSVKIISVADILKQKNKKKSKINIILCMREMLKKESPDLVVSFMTMMNMYSVIAMQGMKTPIIVSERNDPDKECPGKIKKIIRNLCYNKADGIVFQTTDASLRFSQGIRSKSTVIANPVKKGLPNWNGMNSNIVVAVGRFEEQKNYPVMFDAFKRFHQEYPEYQLHVYGDGRLRDELEHLLKDIEADKFIYLDGVQEDVHSLTRNACMYLLSSDYEGIPNALLESLAIGIPCIATDCPCGGVHQLIQNGENGYLIPVGDSDALYNRMQELIRDPNKAIAISRKAVSTRKIYSEELICGKYFDYFKKIMVAYEH